MATTRSHRWGQRASFGALMVIVTAGAGCAPQLDSQQYGKTLPGVPLVEGADEPYLLPRLEDPAIGPTGETEDPQK